MSGGLPDEPLHVFAAGMRPFGGKPGLVSSSGMTGEAYAEAQQSCRRDGMAATTTATSSYLQRLIGAAALDTGVYEEIEADESATTQAFITVLMSSAAA